MPTVRLGAFATHACEALRPRSRQPNCWHLASTYLASNAVIPFCPAGRFSSGFDIREFARGLGASGAAAGLMDRMHAALCTLLEVGPKPTVAALERLALGGGLEIAMACNARVCTPGGWAGWRLCPHKQAGWSVNRSDRAC